MYRPIRRCSRIYAGQRSCGVNGTSTDFTGKQISNRRGSPVKPSIARTWPADILTIDGQIQKTFHILIPRWRLTSAAPMPRLAPVMTMVLTSNRGMVVPPFAFVKNDRRSMSAVNLSVMSTLTSSPIRQGRMTREWRVFVAAGLMSCCDLVDDVRTNGFASCQGEHKDDDDSLHHILRAGRQLHDLHQRHQQDQEHAGEEHADS